MMLDPRCFLWRKDGRAAGMFTLPPDATQYPPAFTIHQWNSPGFFRQREGAANQYDEFIGEFIGD